MTLLIDNRCGDTFLKEFETIVETAAKESLCYEGFDLECEISMSIVDNEEIRKINKQFRNIDSVTDVLSFPQLTFQKGEQIQRNEVGEIVLGDIIISLERAKEQAKEYGHSLKREIAFLTTHSMLHLLGYDHMEAFEEKEMFAKQEEILNRMNIPRV